jgi:hypothetical protein
MQTATAAPLIQLAFATGGGYRKECHCRSTTRASMIKKKMVRMGTTPATRHQTKVPLPLRIQLAFATGGIIRRNAIVDQQLEHQ